MPGGWSGKIGGPNFAEPARRSGGRNSFHTPDQVPADPCDPDKGFVALTDKSVDGLVAAISERPMVTYSDVVETTLGGYPARQLTITGPDTYEGCRLTETNEMPVWKLPLGLVWSIPAGRTSTITIVDVAGVTLAVVVDETGFTDQQKAEARAIFNSVQLAPGPDARRHAIATDQDAGEGSSLAGVAAQEADPRVRPRELLLRGRRLGLGRRG